MNDMTATHTRKVLENLKDLSGDSSRWWLEKRILEALISDYEAIKECTCNQE